MYADSDDELEDYEYPDEDERDDELDDDYLDNCPNCDAEIYDDVDYCPFCGEFIVPDASPFTGRSTVWTMLGILGISAVIAAIVIGAMF